MHFYFMTRGIKQQRDLFVKFMETQMFKWKRKDLKTGKDVIHQVQGSLRPVELWEYVFPEENLEEVLTMLDIGEDGGFPNKNFLNEARVAAMRKIIGNEIKPVPKYKKIPTNKFVEKRGVAIIPIGIKKDKRQKVPEWGFEQEMI